MQNIHSIIETNPNSDPRTAKLIGTTVEVAALCSLACVACADACLGEQKLEMLRKCIRLNLDCADTCYSTARLLARRFEADLQMMRKQLEICADACASCGAECAKHASLHDHCRLCAEHCQACEARCRELLHLFSH